MPSRKPAVAALMARVSGADKTDAGRAWTQLVALGPAASSSASALRPMLKERDPRRCLGARAVLERAAAGKLRALPTPMVADARRCPSTRSSRSS